MRILIAGSWLASLLALIGITTLVYLVVCTQVADEETVLNITGTISLILYVLALIFVPLGSKNEMKEPQQKEIPDNEPIYEQIITDSDSDDQDELLLPADEPLETDSFIQFFVFLCKLKQIENPCITLTDYKEVDIVSLVKQIEEFYKKNYGFWELINEYIIQQKFNDKEEFFRNWLAEYIKNNSEILPQNTDPFIKALFTHDIEEACALGSKISPYLPAIIRTPPIANTPKEDKPQFLIGKKFQYGSNTIAGEDIWSLLVGDIKPFISSQDVILGEHWILPFAIQVWYSNDQSLYQAFGNFSLLQEGKSWTIKMSQDPLYWLLAYVLVNDSENAFPNMLSVMKDKTEAFIFAVLCKQVNSSVLVISNPIYNITLMACLRELEAKYSWDCAASVLLLLQESMQELSHALDNLLQRNVFISSTLTCYEHFASNPFYEELNLRKKNSNGIVYPSLEEVDVNEKIIYSAKGEKCLYLSGVGTPRQEDFNYILQLIINAVENFVKANNYQRALDSVIAYLNFVVETGIGFEKLENWVRKLEPLKETNDMIVLEALIQSTKTEKTLSTELLERTKNILEEKWGNFKLRRMVCSVLIKKDDAYKYLANVDAVPKDEYISKLSANR